MIVLMSLVAPHFVGKKRDIFAYISLLLDVSTFMITVMLLQPCGM